MMNAPKTRNVEGSRCVTARIAKESPNGFRIDVPTRKTAVARNNSRAPLRCPAPTNAGRLWHDERMPRPASGRQRLLRQLLAANGVSFLRPSSAIRTYRRIDGEQAAQEAQ